jgi:hypothetical protein
MFISVFLNLVFDFEVSFFEAPTAFDILINTDSNVGKAAIVIPFKWT